jgi:hypothetical protein
MQVLASLRGICKPPIGNSSFDSLNRTSLNHKSDN